MKLLFGEMIFPYLRSSQRFSVTEFGLDEALLATIIFWFDVDRRISWQASCKFAFEDVHNALPTPGYRFLGASNRGKRFLGGEQCPPYPNQSVLRIQNFGLSKSYLVSKLSKWIKFATEPNFEKYS